VVHRAIEVLGGNGAIESFSILPRLYRDMVVLESWEGTHNVLALQVLRDIGRYNLHEGFLRSMQTVLDAAAHDDLQPQKAIITDAIDRFRQMLQRIHTGDARYQQAHARRMVDMAGYIAQAALMLREAQYEIDNDRVLFKPDIVTYFVNQHLVPGYDPMQDDTCIERLERLLTAF
jgi:alkylation response protein AidB-like acyl-CoA dehydrogenase